MKRPDVTRLVSLSVVAGLALTCMAVAAPADKSDAELKAGWPPQFKAAPGARIRDNGWFPRRVSRNMPQLPEEVTRVFVIPIQDAISGATYDAVKRKVERCRQGSVQMIIFDMNTPGGDSGAMLDIGRLIVDGLKDVYTVAYVNPQAFSAGAIIAFACDEIVMTPTGVIGAATPLMMGPQGLVEIPKPVRGKLEAAFRSEARAWVKQNGYNPDLCQATITVSMEIWLIRNPRGELRVVDARDWRGRVKGVPKESDPSPEDLARAPDGPWEFAGTIAGTEEPVSLDSDEAFRYGLIDHRFESMEELLDHYNIAGRPVRLEDNWSEVLVAFLTSPMVMSILIFIAIIAGYTEMNTPGLGIPGLVAVVCLAIAFGSQFLVGMALWWEIALIVIGVVLIGIEVFVIPGFGLTGVVGGLCFAIGLLGSIVAQPLDAPPIPSSSFAWSMFAQYAVALGVAFVLALMAMPVVSKFLPKIPVAGKLVLAPSVAVSDAPVSDDSPMKRIRVGDTGIVEGMCRPVGKVRFGDDIVDAMTEGDLIEAGARVRVLRREGNRLVVERAG